MDPVPSTRQTANGLSLPYWVSHYHKAKAWAEGGVITKVTQVEMKPLRLVEWKDQKVNVLAIEIEDINSIPHSGRR